MREIPKRVSATQEPIPIRWNYEFRDPTADIEQMFGHQIPIVPVHKRNLWGIQTLHEYQADKRKHLKKDFKGKSVEEIFTILQEHPVHAVALPMNLFQIDLWDHLDPREKYLLTVLDGHHRIRFSPREIREIPTMVFTVDQAFQTYQRRYRGTIQQFVDQIVAERGEALDSFTRVKDGLLPGSVYISHHTDESWSVRERLV